MDIYCKFDPIKNKYHSWYYNLIEKARNRSKIDGVYYEAHHIIPKCLGGKDVKTNMANLTLREHYVAHLLLSKMFTGETRRKMYYALWRMLLNVKKRNSRVFEIYRKQYIEVSLKTQVISEETRRKISAKKMGKPRTRTEKMIEAWKNRSMIGPNNPMFGKKHSEETKNKMRLSHANKVISEETRKKLSEIGKGRKRPEGIHLGNKNPMFGKKHSEETRKKISEAGKKRYQRYRNSTIAEEN